MNVSRFITERAYLKSFVSVGAVQGGFMILNYAAQLILANHLSAQEYGKLTYYLSLVNFFVVVILLGQNAYLPRELIRRAALGLYAEIRTLIRRSFIHLFIAWLLCAVIAIGGVYFDIINVEMGVVLPLAGIVLFLGAGTLRQAVQRAYGQIRISQIPEKLMFSGFYVAALAVSVFVFDAEWTVLSLLLLVAALYFSVQAAGALMYKYGTKKIPREAVRGSDRDRTKTTRKYFYIMSVVDILDSNLDYYMLEYFSDYESLAVYSVAKRISMLVFMVIYTSNYVLGPEISKLFYSGQKRELETRIKKAVLLNAVLATLLAGGLLLFRTPILNLFGEFYAREAGFYAYLFLLAAQWVNVTLGAPGQILTSSGFEKSVLYVFVIAVVFQLSAGPWVIVNYGITGMAVLFFVNSLYWNGALHYLAVKKTGIRLWRRG